MMTVDSGEWDETVCNMVACQHPTCWEALRRIEKGVPRILFKLSERDSPEPGDEVPTLKIVDLPFDYSEKGHLASSESSTSISKTISNIRHAKGFHSTSTLNDLLFPPVSVVKSASFEKNPSPVLNPRADSHTPFCTPTGLGYWKPTVQVSDLGVLVEPSMDQQTPQPALVVKWVPGIRHRFLEPESSTSSIESTTQRMRVKELALESILSLSEKPEFKRKKSSKIPTGGQPYRLHLKRDEKVPNYRASFALPEKERNQSVSPGRKRQYPPNLVQRSPLVLLQSESTLDLENRSGRWTKEKVVLPIIVKKPPSLSKSDSKVVVKEKCPRKRSEKTSRQEAASRGPALLKSPVPNTGQQVDYTPRTTQLSRKAFAEKRLQSEVSANQATSRRKSSVTFVEFKSSKTDLTMEGLAPLLSPTEGLQFPAGRALVSGSSQSLSSGEGRSPPLPSDSPQLPATRVLVSQSVPGFDSSTPRISRSKSYYNVLCKITAKQKEVMSAQDVRLTSSREQWPKGATQESEDVLLSQSPNPPPPSPLFSEISESLT